MGPNMEYLGGMVERRRNTRFPLCEEITYKLLHGGAHPVTGTGVTLNIGSSGILLSTAEKLPVGRTVELSINWPARLHGTCPLKMIAMGRVIRSEPTRA